MSNMASNTTLRLLALVFFATVAIAQPTSTTSTTTPTSTASTDLYIKSANEFSTFWNHNWYYFLAGFLGLVLPLLLFIIFGPVRKYYRKRKRNSTPVLWGNIGEEAYAVKSKKKERGESQSTLSTTRNSSLRNLDLEKAHEPDSTERRQTTCTLPQMERQETGRASIAAGRNDSVEAVVGLGPRKSTFEALEVCAGSPYEVVGRFPHQQAPVQMASVYPQRQSVDHQQNQAHEQMRTSVELPPMPRMSFKPYQHPQVLHAIPTRHHSLQYTQSLRYPKPGHGSLAATHQKQANYQTQQQQRARTMSARIVRPLPMIQVLPPTVQHRQLLYSPPLQYGGYPQVQPQRVSQDSARANVEEYKRIASEEHRNFSWNMPRRAS